MLFRRVALLLSGEPANLTSTSPPTGTPTAPSTTLSTAAPDFFTDLLDQIPLPRWVVYTIFSAGALLLLLLFLCICIKCCKHKVKKKKRNEQMDLKGLEASSRGLVQSGAQDSNYGAAEQPRGKLQYSLGYNPALSELTVGIKQAAELRAMDLGGTSDPYVRVYIFPDKSKTCETKVFRSTLNPVFNQQFTFQVPKASLACSSVVMQVFDFNRFTKHAVIGELRLELYAIDWTHMMEQWQDLCSPAHFEEENLGELCFSLRYVPAAGKLTVVILEAKNLKSMDLGGASDPYVKVQLALDKRKWKKRKTSVKKKTLNPYFNESFSFDVSFELIQRVNLVVSVWDHDTVSRNDAMGKIFLGCDAAGNQLRHWADMLANPRRPVAQWHPLLSAQQVNQALALKKRTLRDAFH